MQTENEMGKTKKRRGWGLGKSALMTALSVAVVFLVWLFYPINPPQDSLRRHLPPDCALVLEFHDLQGLLDTMQQRNFWQQLRELPVAAALSDYLKKYAATDFDQDCDQITAQALELAQRYSLLHNRVKAAALAIKFNGDKTPAVCALLYLDNPGFMPFNLLSLISKKEIAGELKYFRFPLTDQTKTATVSELCVAIIPKTRIVALSSDAEFLQQVTVTPRPREEVPSRFYEDKQTTVEGEFSLKNFDFDKSMILPELPGKLTIAQMSGSFFWDLEKAALRAQAEFIPTAPVTEISASHLNFVRPPEKPGLGAWLSIPAPQAAELGRQLVKTAGAAGATGAAKPLAEYLRDNFSGQTALSFQPQNNSSFGALNIYFSVVNLKQAAAQFPQALKLSHEQLLKETNDIFARIALQQLAAQKINETSGKLPLPGLPGDSAPHWSFINLHGQDYSLLSLGKARPEFAGSMLSSAEKRPLLYDAGINWLYSENAIMLLNTLQGYGLADLLPGNAKDLQKAVALAELAVKTLDSLQQLKLKAQAIGASATSSTNETKRQKIRLEIDCAGCLRIK